MQESQLIEFGANALGKADFATEPLAIRGTLFKLEDPSKSIT